MPKQSRPDSAALAVQPQSESLADYWKVVPRQIPRYWIEGRFNNSQYRSARYNNLGWSLLIRGLYWYEVVNKGLELRHAGLAEIDFLGATEEMRIRGIRLSDGKLKPQIVFWQSTLSKVSSDLKTGRLDFAYKWVPLELRSISAEVKELREFADSACDKIAYDKLGDTKNCLKNLDPAKLYEWLTKHFDENFGKLDHTAQYALVICEEIK